MEKESAKRLALGIALCCVRNTSLENIHAGIEPDSRSGDFSDVQVVTPDGAIPWNNLSRIRNDEMRDLMKEVVNKIYTVLLRLDDPAFVERMDRFTRRATIGWDEPKNLPDWFTGQMGSEACLTEFKGSMNH